MTQVVIGIVSLPPQAHSEAGSEARRGTALAWVIRSFVWCIAWRCSGCRGACRSAVLATLPDALRDNEWLHAALIAPVRLDWE